MTHLEFLKARSLELRKARSPLASLLQTLVGEAEAVGKNKRNGAPTDEETLKVLQKMHAGVVETIALVSKTCAPSEAAQVELVELSSLVVALTPQQLTAAELNQTIDDIVAELSTNATPKLGDVMGMLKQRHAGTYDAKLASTIVRAKLA